MKEERPSCLDNSPARKKEVGPKCGFCHQIAVEKFSPDSDINLKELYFCSAECKKQIVEYADTVHKKGMLFLGIIFGTVFLMVIASGMVAAFNCDNLYGLLITYAAMFVLGATIMVFPFCTPQTVQWFGIKKSKIIGRCLGLSLIIGAIVMLLKTIMVFL